MVSIKVQVKTTQCIHNWEFNTDNRYTDYRIAKKPKKEL